MTYVKVVYLTWPRNNNMTAQLYAHRIVKRVLAVDFSPTVSRRKLYSPITLITLKLLDYSVDLYFKLDCVQLGFMDGLK